MSRASVLRDVAVLGRGELAALAPEWSALAADAAEANPYYEPWSLLPSLDAYADATLRVVAVRRDGALVALFPLERVARHRGLPAAALRSWRHRHMLLCTPLVRRGYELHAFSMLLHWVRASREASILEFDYVPDGPVRGAFAAALEAGGHAWSVSRAFERAILVRGTDANAYLAAALDGDTRRELRRKEKRLREAGEARFVRLEKGGDIERWIEDFLALEASGWKGKAGGAFACRDEDRRYAQALFRAAFHAGGLLATGVDLDGRPIARELSFRSGAGAVSFKIAYDEAFGRYAPGLLCGMETIRAFHDAPGLQWLDSATGEDNTTIGRLWKARRRIERVTAATDGWGRLVLSLLPALRWARRAVPAGHGRTSSPSSAARP